MQESEVVTRTGLVLLIDDDGNGEEERVDELADVMIGDERNMVDLVLLDNDKSSKMVPKRFIFKLGRILSIFLPY
ncbi:hypothetical protein M0R45_035854 [Rubus argutus]|uniref:Uncharacterized protein n=1 Tax=Rubus argutus TaxID=59490 RepID=A0AAW1VYX4_RUBAR